MAGFIDKIAVVTGGGSGIGKTICTYLAKRGARVVAADRNLEAVEETAALIRSTGVLRRAGGWMWPIRGMWSP